MAEVSTFIKLDRNIKEWRWYKNPITKIVFIHLLLNANIKDQAFEKIIIHRGELVTSYNHLAEDLGITARQARTAIENLVCTGEVKKTAHQGHTKYLVITVLNYNRYQEVPQMKVTSKSFESHSKVNNQRSKEYKEYKKENISPFQGISIEEARNQ